VCLNVGCIPSKALLHVAKVIADAEVGADKGIAFKRPRVDLERVRSWKDGVVGRLTKGVEQLAKQRKVRVVHGVGEFRGPHTMVVSGPDAAMTVSFESAIVAAGSQAVKIPGFPHDDPRVMNSTDALELPDIPQRLLVVGGGVTGLELATVYDALGSRVTVVEMSDSLIPEADRDLVRRVHARIQKRYDAVHLGTRVESIDAREDGLHATFSGDIEDAVFDRALVAVGRVPNGAGLALDSAAVDVDERGFIPVDAHRRTNVPHVFAIGDVTQGPMLTHKAHHEGHVAAEAAAGRAATFHPPGIPTVAYTEPEVAWVGLTEVGAKEGGVPYQKVAFPWSAEGRALALDGASGATKLLYEPESKRLLGAGVVGPYASELIAEIALALELGADVTDVARTIHPHPTLSETVGLAAELADETITDLLNPATRRKKTAA
jgi:dihydrolipoamide dehydrogenase